MKGYFLKPGFIFFAAEPTMILSVLGSSVAITLYDPVRRIGGMNHYIYPRLEEQARATALYAQPATLQLLRMFRRTGSPLQHLQAHLMGGAYKPGAAAEIRKLGEQNVDIARDMLKRYQIPILGTDTGGPWGRKIVFNSATGEVVIAKVHKIRESDWYPGELPARR
ncbi:hypothetical protein GF324_09435 [bacterium]|nr:hypothetical protein [bacterium]